MMRRYFPAWLSGQTSFTWSGLGASHQLTGRYEYVLYDDTQSLHAPGGGRASMLP